MQGMFLLLLAGLSLTICLLSPLLHFIGVISFDAYQTTLNLASLAWFMFAGWWTVRRSKRNQTESSE